MISRRNMLLGGAGTLLAGCDKLNGSETFRGVLRSAEGLTMRAQRLITDREALAREYDAADMSPIFRANGNVMPNTSEYQAHLAARFADWRLAVDGLVRTPLSLSLAQLRAMPRRSFTSTSFMRASERLKPNARRNSSASPPEKSAHSIAIFSSCS